MRAAIILFLFVILSGCEGVVAPSNGDGTDVVEVNNTPPSGIGMIGRYLCTVAEKASIESLHLEGSEPPSAVSRSNLKTKFRIRISEEKGGEKTGLRLVELPYDYSDRDPAEWHTPNSVLHGLYLGDGQSFQSVEKDAEAFFVLGGPTVHSNADGNLSFYHSGFEWAGGEDTYLSVRWGRCKKT